MQTSGTDLKVERVRANVTIKALSARLGISRQAIWSLERAAVVDASRVKAYREALACARDANETSDEGVA